MLVSVLLADDRAIIRRSIRRLLDPEDRIRIVAEADTFASTVDQANTLKPAIVVMDLHMPFRNHVSAEDVKAQLADRIPRLFAISFAIDRESQVLAASCGACRLFDKTLLADQLVPAILDSAQLA